MEEKLNKLISYCRQVDNVYLKNELKDLKTKNVLSIFFAICVLKQWKNELQNLNKKTNVLTAKLEVYGQN
jgi:hypothetical protein